MIAACRDPVVRLAAGTLVLACAGALGVAATQDAPAADPHASTWVEPTIAGTSLANCDIVEVAATADGARTQFDPIPPDVAFELWLDRVVLGKPGEPAPPPAAPVVPVDPAAAPAAPADPITIPVMRVSVKEWDEYFAFMTKDAPPESMISKFRTGLLASMMDQKSFLLFQRSIVPEVEQRAAAAVKKIKRGAAFKDVVKVHSEDDTSKQISGLVAEDTKSGLFTQYPFSMVLFAMKPGEATGPIYTRNAAYILRCDKFTRSNNPWFDTVTASGVVIKYSSKSMGSKALGTVKSAVRVRTDQDRFKKILPPAMQVPVPTTFGPDDIAPVGNPNAPLRTE